MAHPVFISYAQKASRSQALALHEALGGKDGLAFIDTSDIEPGESFPRDLADALLASRVVVVFATKDYFRRWYCLWELETALGPYTALASGAEAVAKDRALAHIVVALPPQGGGQRGLLPLPPALHDVSWLKADDIAGLAKLIRARLEQNPATLKERLDAAGNLGTSLRTRLLEKKALYEPVNLAAFRHYPLGLPCSLGDSFVGRADDLWRIHYVLTVLRGRRGEGASGAALTGALHGAGGFGKTRLALEYLHRLGPSEHPGGLFWVNAEVGPERLEEQFHGILRTLAPSVPDLVAFRKSERNAAHELAVALEGIAARERVLFVVDNVPEPKPGEAQKPLETWCPAIGKVSLLATSRARLDLGAEGIQPLALSTLKPEAAVALLTEGVARGSVDDAGWLRIAEWVGHLPLALELLNRAMKVGGLIPEEVLSRAESQEPVPQLDEQAKFLQPHVPANSLRGITEALSLSYERLPENVQRAARLIAQLAPEPIPLELFKALGEDVASGDVRTSLGARHFVTPAEAGQVPMLGSMHRVLASYLRGTSPGRREELEHVCKSLLVIMTPAACRDPHAWPLLQACLPHAEHVFTRQGRLGERESIEHEVKLGLALGLFLYARGLAGHARTIEEEAVERAKEFLGPEHLATLTAMSNIAGTLRAQGDLGAARELQGRVLEVMRRVLGEEHPITLTAMNNLAETFRVQGDLGAARELQGRVLEIRRRVLGKEHPATLTAMLNLASTLWAQENLEAARELQGRVLEVRRRVLGEEHPDTLMAMNNLASTLWAQRDLGAARELQGHVLEVMRRVLGEEHPDTLMAMNNLTQIRQTQENVSKPRSLWQRLLAMLSRR